MLFISVELLLNKVVGKYSSENALCLMIIIYFCTKNFKNNTRPHFFFTQGVSASVFQTKIVCVSITVAKCWLIRIFTASGQITAESPITFLKIEKKNYNAIIQLILHIMDNIVSRFIWTCCLAWRQRLRGWKE